LCTLLQAFLMHSRSGGDAMCNAIEAGLVTAEGTIQFRSTPGSEREGLRGIHRHPLASVCVARMRVVGRMRFCS
jgi:hypothetical protein